MVFKKEMGDCSVFRLGSVSTLGSGLKRLSPTETLFFGFYGHRSRNFPVHNDAYFFENFFSPLELKSLPSVVGMLDQINGRDKSYLWDVKFELSKELVAVGCKSEGIGLMAGTLLDTLNESASICDAWVFAICFYLVVIIQAMPT